MSSKVSSGKNHDHSDSKQPGGYAGKGSSTTADKGSKNSTQSGSQQSGNKEDNKNSTSQAPKGKDS